MLQHKIELLIKPIIEDMGYILWGCEYLPQGKYAVLRVYIDQEAGIGVTDCEQVSRRISAILDVEDPISGNYSLEVSSPGIPRPIFYRWQYEQYIGHEIQVKLLRPLEGKRKFSGIIVSVSDDTLIINVDNEQQEIPVAHIVKANLTV